MLNRSALLGVIFSIVSIFSGAQSWGHTAVQITQLGANDPHVTANFASLGEMIQVGDLIWSGVHSEEITFSEAWNFCDALEEGSRLPTKEEYEELRKSIGYPDQFDPNLLPEMNHHQFWTSTPYEYSAEGFFTGEWLIHSSVYKFDGNNGTLFGDWAHLLEIWASVRCVINLGH